MAQMVESLPSKHKALSSTLRPPETSQPNQQTKENTIKKKIL
jgi:hypothetical protein